VIQKKAKTKTSGKFNLNISLLYKIAALIQYLYIEVYLFTGFRNDEYADFGSIEDPFENKEGDKELKKPAPPSVKRLRKEDADETDPSQPNNNKLDRIKIGKYTLHFVSSFRFTCLYLPNLYLLHATNIKTLGKYSLAFPRSII
jgi:hypothetical protein